MKNLLIVLSLLLFVGLACDAPKESDSKSSSEETTTSEEKPIGISAEDLTKAYDENELSADKKYKGKTLEVSGRIENIADTLGNVTVSLKGHNAVVSVMCSFEESEKDSVANLKKGQKTTLIGKGDGYTAGLYAGLNKCKIK